MQRVPESRPLIGQRRAACAIGTIVALGAVLSVLAACSPESSSTTPESTPSIMPTRQATTAGGVELTEGPESAGLLPEDPLDRRWMRQFVAPQPLTLSLTMREEGEPDLVFSRDFEAGETVAFGYRSKPWLVEKAPDTHATLVRLRLVIDQVDGDGGRPPPVRGRTLELPERWGVDYSTPSDLAVRGRPSPWGDDVTRRLMWSRPFTLMRFYPDDGGEGAEPGEAFFALIVELTARP